MNNNDNSYVQHILDAVAFIERHTSNVSRDDFLKDEVLQSAIIRQFEIIGEASAQLSEKIQQEYPELPWPRIISMRNKLIHEYFGVDIEIVWEAVQDEIPFLKQTLTKIRSR